MRWAIPFLHLKETKSVSRIYIYRVYCFRSLLPALRRKREPWRPRSLSNGKRLVKKSQNKSISYSIASCSPTSLATALSSRNWGTKSSSTVSWTWLIATGRWDINCKSFAFLIAVFSGDFFFELGGEHQRRQAGCRCTWHQGIAKAPCPSLANKLGLFWVQVLSRL